LISCPLDLVYTIAAVNPTPPRARASIPARRSEPEDEDEGLGVAELLTPRLNTFRELRVAENLINAGKSTVTRDAIAKIFSG
jgi:hypothetical protein